MWKYLARLCSWRQAVTPSKHYGYTDLGSSNRSMLGLHVPMLVVGRVLREFALETISFQSLQLTASPDAQ